MSHSDGETEMCPECEAKMARAFDRLTAAVGEIGPELEAWQMVLLLIEAAGNVSSAGKVEPAEFMSYVRQTVHDEYGLTITGVAFSSPDFETVGAA